MGDRGLRVDGIKTDRDTMVRFYASARDVAGTAHVTVRLPVGATLGDLCAELGERFGGRMQSILEGAAFLQHDEMIRDRAAVAAESVDILPPFAGG